jgi:hypothetical protein
MRRTPVALVPVAVSLLLAACVGDRDTTAPTGLAPRPTASSLNLPACNFTNLKGYVRDFFDSPQDVAKDLADQMSRASEPTRTALGWQIINEISLARLTSRQETPWSATAAAGEALALNVFACSQGIGSLSSVNAGSLASAIFNGIFEVRGGPFPNQGPALGYLVVNNVKTLSFPHYGVENRPANTSWAGNPFLIVGVPTQYGPTFVGTVNINTNGTPVNGFDLFSIPVAQSKANKVIGVCVKTIATTGSVANLLIHDGVLQHNISPTQLDCSSTSSLSNPTWFAALSRRAASFFMPNLAYAQLLGEDYSGGGPTSWSPNQVGAVPGTNVQLAFTSQSPKRANIGDTFTFEVTATINNHPVPDVVVTIGIDGNFGTPGFINGPVQATTNGQGVAHFEVSFTKAGGTYLLSIGDLGGVATQTARSNQFWVGRN